MPPKKAYPLRIDPELYSVIEHWAGDEFRSINQHIEYLLREAAKKAGRLPKHKGSQDQQDHVIDS